MYICFYVFFYIFAFNVVQILLHSRFNMEAHSVHIANTHHMRVHMYAEQLLGFGGCLFYSEANHQQIPHLAPALPDVARSCLTTACSLKIARTLDPRETSGNLGKGLWRVAECCNVRN